MKQYTLTEINKLIQTNEKNTLSDETIIILQNLAELVGAPEYNKTPQFKNKGQITSSRRRKKTGDLTDEDWHAIRNFQATEFQKNDGIEKNLDIIRKNLNMITFKNYDTIKEMIINEIKKGSVEDGGIRYLAEKIFNIVSINSLYSEIYAKLYMDLITEFKEVGDFKNNLIEKYENMETIFNTIEYCDPENDYEKFCDNNKQNENRRALCLFYINLVKLKVIDINIIGSSLLKVFQKLFKYISLKNKVNEIDELSELIYILVVNSYDLLSLEHSQKIHENVLAITNIKVRNEPGITNKCIFKHMDILDEIE